ncbi:MAG: DNA helicase RecQ [Candidatus Onthomorpha sp.]|nr:DNA helicase RecQ [Bacteroidales bacterium]MDY3976922.1 DNA helicase RecQ [Candidatus Onthomorpha sp.]MCI5716735.1 DNA helicase RecQ [Bacteroidales bacterium]MCI6416815.1 DNA helicase RecQ [Bacteroidales bacterium]MCI6800399.1 DNA helicase RecQ [Bacteroidales bacterium]
MEDINSALKRLFGFDKFKGNQEKIIRSLLAGKNVFVIMPTGGGKSLCYQLPALISEGTAIIISPLISLMKNQVDFVRGVSTNSSIAHFLNSTLNRHEIAQVREDLLSGKTKLLYVAPESLNKQENIELLQSIKISFYAIDEAHCISEWGHDFRPEYRRIHPIIENISGNIPVIALTATATPKVQQDILKNLEIQDADIYISSFNRPNLYYEIRPKPKDEFALNKELIRFINNHKDRSGIIYCLSRKKVEELTETLVVNGIKALPYHAGLDAVSRANNQDMFIREEIDVIVATIAFGMGIDKPDVRYVIHYDMPKSLEGYYQETGRAGRDDGEGLCIAFYSEKDMEKLEKFLTDKPVSEREVTQQLIDETISYAESSQCRRKTLLKYFGEDYEQENCGNCDNCLHPKPLIEATDAVRDFIEMVIETKEQYKAPYLINIIRGEATSEVKTNRHHKLELFGVGKDQPENFWKAVARVCIIKNLLRKDIERYGQLKLTQEGAEYVKRPFPIQVPMDRNFEDDDQDNAPSASGAAAATDPVLYSILKDLRRQTADREGGLPPYVIFEDRSLVDMCIQYPITEEELKNVTGVGVHKAQKYGKPFLAAIKSYVETNNITRPQDLVIKSVVNKSGLKVFIIRSIDKKLPLESIAESKNMDMDELITEIESIVSSGTKLDLSYYIEETIDPEHQEEINEVLMDMETDDIDEVLEELGEDEYSREEVRLMRLQFLTKYGQ